MTQQSREDTISPQPSASDDTRDLKKVLWSTFISLGVVTVAVIIIAVLFKEQLISASRWFVDSFGGPGVAVGFFIPDAFTVPLPNDAFSTFGVLGGLGYWEVVFWGSLGSLA